jgi:ATP-dependent RNA helicase SUPV3L1/SUV3
MKGWRCKSKRDRRRLFKYPLYFYFFSVNLCAIVYRKIKNSKDEFSVKQEYFEQKPDEPTMETIRLEEHDDENDFIYDLDITLPLPHEWYPEARKMKRDIYFHMGPTNSGKTFEALNSLKVASTGIYWAPLRLLAWEVAEKLNDEGVKCSLKTGQERSISEYDTHISCTIEMCDISKQFDVAVIDEIQMISDFHRGNAWTHALLGLQAKEIHLCGDQRSLQLISKLWMQTEDTLKIREYQRLSQLKVDQKPIRSFRDLRVGDWIVGFSKRLLFQMKREINESLDQNFLKRPKNLRANKESSKSFKRKIQKNFEEWMKDNPIENKWALIYGSLPPETKKTQAIAFNERTEGVKFLVATNAIGMGLNLNINRVIFTNIYK